MLRKALELDNKEPAIYNALALLALEQGKEQEAFERFDHATALDPTYLDARFNKASVLLDAGDFTRAKQELDHVVELGPTISTPRSRSASPSAVCATSMAREPRGRDVVKEAPRRSATRGDALFNLAVLEMDHLSTTRRAAALDRYLQEAGKSHSKRQEAEERKKELGL